MAVDPKQIVADGYDDIAPRYLAWSALAPSPERMRYLDRLLDLLPAGAGVLDLRCGVTGVDISAEQIDLAERYVPDATFIRADMAALDFAPGSFDAVVAFYSLTHVPRAEHAGLLRRIAGWLRDGGLLLATMGAHD